MSASDAKKTENPRFTVQVVHNGYILATSVPDKGKTVGISETYVYSSLNDLQSAIEEWVYNVRKPDES